jgi:hypothetical protein
VADLSRRRGQSVGRRNAHPGEAFGERIDQLLPSLAAHFMKRILLALLLLSSTAFADNVDKIVQDAISHGCHGMSYKTMRFWAEAGAHYEPRDNSWTNEQTYQPVQESHRYWVYFDQSGTIWINGTLREYVRSRGLMADGHKYVTNGHTVWQVQLQNGQWADVYPQ